MNKSQLSSGIRRTWAIVSALDVGECFTNPAPFEPSEAFRTAAFNPTIQYEQLFLTGLENSDYNFILRDTSFFQFGITGVHHVRYAYYPNPFIGASREAISEISELRANIEEGLISVEDYLHKISEVRTGRQPPLIRYENAPSQYVPSKHPCSHFHLGHHDENRWALQRTLTPSAFGLIILKHFYTHIWNTGNAVQIFGAEWSLDTLLINEKRDCRILGDDLFNETEKQLFVYT